MSKRAEQRAREAYPYEGDIKGLICENAIPIYIRAYEQAEKDLGWHSVDECLPKIGKQVIVLRLELSKALKPSYRISFGEVRELVGEKVWDMPGVRYWMPCPKLPEE